jgi:hypothetical protein
MGGRLLGGLGLIVALAAIGACAKGETFGEGGGDGDDGAGARGAGDAAGGGGGAVTCAGDPCDPHATCDDSSGAVSCSCEPGWQGSGEICSDVDECATDPCGPGMCANEPGGYGCSCDPGYEERDGTCVAEDECGSDNGGCADVCTCVDTPEAAPVCECVLTHSTMQTVAGGNSAACTYKTMTEHAENSYYRVYDLAALGVPSTLSVTGMKVGVELAQSAGTQPVQLRLHTLNGAFVTANLSLLASTTVNVGNVGNAVLEYPLVASVPASTTLVAEVFTADGLGLGNLFYMGANAAAETAPSYLRAPTCGFTEPVTTSAIGYPNMHIVLNVLGTYPAP